MHELDVLKWAAGAIRPLPRLNDIDHDLLLDGIQAHRLEGRLLRRLKLNPQPWAGQMLLDDLEARQSDAERQMRSRIETMNEIHREYSLSGQTVIAIKGYTAYFLLRDPAAIRASGDIDLLCSDPNGMRETLSRLGFEYHPDQGVDNHHANQRAYRGDLSVDNYSFIPLWSYPDDITSDSFDSKLNPGVWNQTAQAVHTDISLTDLVEHQQRDLSPEAGSLLVPDPTMTVLILCSHIFADFLQKIPVRFRTLPLVHFAEIGELIRHPDFDPKHFATLVRRFQGFDSVQFASRLFNSFMGYHPFNSGFLGGDHRIEWKIFYRFAFWVPAPWRSDDLLLPLDPSEPLRNLLDELGANVLLASEEPIQYTGWAVAPGKGEPFERVVTRNIGDRQLPMNISLSWDGDTMVMGLDVVGLPDLELDAIYVQCDGYFSLWFVNRDRLVLEEKGHDHMWTGLTFNEKGYHLRVAFPQEVWKNSSGNDRPIPLLVAACRKAHGRLGVGTTGKTVSATLVPINVMRA